MILVTGGTGLVGSHLLYRLTQKHSKIRAIYRREKKIESAKHVFGYYSENPTELFDKIEWIEATLNDIPKLTESFIGITHVYHCAAMVSFDPGEYHQLRQINITGTANIVNLCISNSISKLCYVSSIAALGGKFKTGVIKEDTPWNPDGDHNVYSITKYGAEMEVWRGTQEGVNAVIVNPGMIVGPGFWKSSSGSIFTRIHRGLKHYTTGISGYVDIDDVIVPMIKLMDGNFSNERYTLIGENITFQKFTQMVAKSIHVKPPEKEATVLMLKIGWRMDLIRSKLKGKRRRLTKRLVRSILQNSEYDNSKVKKELNYSFKSIQQSVDETAVFFLKDFD